MSLIVIFDFLVKTEALDDMRSFLKEAMPATRSYGGCEGVDLFSNTDNPTNLVLHERWDSRESYQSYIAWRTETGTMDKFAAALAAPPSVRYFYRVDS